MPGKRCHSSLKRERLAGPDNGSGTEQLDFLEGAFDVDLGVDAVVGIGGTVFVREALDEELIAEEMGRTILSLLRRPDLLGVGASGVGAEKDVFETEGEARVFKIGEGAEGEGWVTGA